jgi:dTDP-4-dehydrorhamnose reductase
MQEQTLRSQTPRSFYEDEYRSPIFVGDITRLIAWILEGQASQTGASAGRSDPMAAALEARMKAISGLEVSVSHPWWPIPVGIYNLGGPDRLSRVDMVSAVASHLGLAMDCVQKASSASGKRDVPSPLDISMDSSKLQALLPFRLSKFCQGLKQVFPSS